jgi:hypothetical protein
MSAAPGASSEVPIYDMLARFFSRTILIVQTNHGQTTPMAGLTAQSSQMVMMMVPNQPVPLSVVPSTLAHRHNNAYAIIPFVYSTIAHTSPPIPNIASSYGVPNDVFTDLHYIQNTNQPLVSSFNTSAPIQSQLTA